MEAEHCGQATTIFKGEQGGVEEANKGNLQLQNHPMQVLQKGFFLPVISSLIYFVLYSRLTFC
jgi:hypothetical protein